MTLTAWRTPRSARGSTLGFIEVHIEQGPVLERAGRPLGVVTAINGARRLSVAVQGIAGHAGTSPMAMRRDSLVAAAEMILAVERIAKETRDVVATVGVIEARPGAVNVIPGETRFSCRCPRARGWRARRGRRRNRKRYRGYRRPPWPQSAHRDDASRARYGVRSGV